MDIHLITMLAVDLTAISILIGGFLMKAGRMTSKIDYLEERLNKAETWQNTHTTAGVEIRDTLTRLETNQMHILRKLEMNGHGKD